MLDFTHIIKSRITIQDILTAYNIKTNASGRIPCPIHRGKDKNFGYNNKVFHCFVCGSRGDVIGLVQALDSCDFKQAVKKIDVLFSLNLFEKPTFSQYLKIKKEQEQRENERKQIDKKRQELTDKYWQTYDELQELLSIKAKYEPKSTDEELHPLFCDALHKITVKQFDLDCIENERWVFMNNYGK